MRKATVMLVALVVLLVMAVPASAKTDRVPLSGEDHFKVAPHGGSTWMSDGVLHVRGSMSAYDTESDSELYQGVTSIVVNYNLDLATMQGRMWGTSHLEVTGYDGGFDGTWVGWFTDTGWAGRGLAHGFGELTGYQARYDLHAAPFGDFVDGFIFMPGNKH